MVLENKQDLLLRSLKSYYSNNDRLKIVYNIVDGNSKISLRLIDFLCTNYAKKNDVVYYIDKKPFNLFLMYRGQLKAYSKLQFDPFRRHERIHISCPFSENKKFETTVGQLNFFKWAIENRVIDYLERNHSKVEQAIVKDQQKLSKTIKKSVKRHNVKVTVTFS